MHIIDSVKYAVFIMLIALLTIRQAMAAPPLQTIDPTEKALARANERLHAGEDEATVERDLKADLVKADLVVTPAPAAWDVYARVRVNAPASENQEPRP